MYTPWKNLDNMEFTTCFGMRAMDIHCPNGHAIRFNHGISKECRS